MRKTKVKYGDRRHQSRDKFKVVSKSFNPYGVFMDMHLTRQDEYLIPPITGFQLYMINQFIDNTNQV